MTVKLASVVLLAFLCSGKQGAIAAPAPIATVQVAQAAPAPQSPPNRSPISTLAAWRSTVWADWVAALGFLLAAGAAAVGIRQYLIFCRWRRREFARSLVQTFLAQPTVRHVTDILDYEEYRLFTLSLADGRTIQFEANDARLRRALRPHDEMVKTRRGLDYICRLQAQGGKLDEKSRQVLIRYQSEEFAIELALREWFDRFLAGLEHFDSTIVAGLLTAEDLRPFVIYWVQVIGDRRFRRKGGSGFYDQLFHYICWAGYSGIQRLFERYGYEILPPPYSTQDFTAMDHPSGDYDADRALCLAKAAHLVYEDPEYVQDIARYWLSPYPDNAWRQLSDLDYVVDLLKRWQRESNGLHPTMALSEHFQYFDIPDTDTQAFLFRKGRELVLVFRGSQQFADWKTNFSFALRPFRVLQPVRGVKLPPGKVHSGFQTAWESVERGVVSYLHEWWTPESRLWVGGHSLGGALAALAATSLHYQGFPLSGLYTFGQPRVGDWQFVQAVNSAIGDRLFRFVNNNDVVPQVPPVFNLLNPTRLYGHMGHFRYFDAFGKLHNHSFPTQRWPDRLLGMLLALREAGTDLVADHMMEFYVRHLQQARKLEQEQARKQKALTAMKVLKPVKTR